MMRYLRDAPHNLIDSPPPGSAATAVKAGGERR